MYTREVLPPPFALIQNKKPVFGTFQGTAQRLDIRGIYMPFGVMPLPIFITNIRIKSKISFTFDIGDFIGNVRINDIKMLAYTDVVFWEKSTGKRFSYRHIMRPRRRLIPHELRAFICTSHHRARYIKISWDRDKNRISLLFSMKGDDARPDSSAAFISHFSEEGIGDVLHVVPFPSMRRCQASYHMALPIHGALSLTTPAQEMKTMEDSDGLGFVDLRRTYLLLRSRGEFVTGLGVVKGKKVVFRIETSSNDAVNADKYNANALFVDGDMTPLPPIRITHPRGLMGRWNIQDTDGMVDLVFTPISNYAKTLSVFIFRTQYNIIYGTFEGALLTKEGEKITFKQLSGIAKHNLLRL